MKPLEWLGFKNWRARLLGRVEPPILEVGIGTGASLRWYNGGLPLIATDVSGNMLAVARQKTITLGTPARLAQMDVQGLAFPDGTFASAITSLVFCSVKHPLRGLQEVHRVLRPGGRLYMLEHVRPENPLLGRLADVLNVPWNLIGSGGCQLNRRTAEVVPKAGFSLEFIESRFLGAVNVIVARA
jgi:phosphatidylethanolamine/phosphatidyl-N-methylethanolamine N-methyltransferase